MDRRPGRLDESGDEWDDDQQSAAWTASFDLIERGEGGDTGSAGHTGDAGPAGGDHEYDGGDGCDGDYDEDGYDNCDDDHGDHCDDDDDGYDDHGDDGENRDCECGSPSEGAFAAAGPLIFVALGAIALFVLWARRA